MVLPQKSGSHLDRVSTVSGSDLNSDQHAVFLTILAHIVDQVATAPCTDPVQAHFLTFEAKLCRVGTVPSAVAPGQRQPTRVKTKVDPALPLSVPCLLGIASTDEGPWGQTWHTCCRIGWLIEKSMIRGIVNVSKSCNTNVISSAVDVLFCVRSSRR